MTKFYSARVTVQQTITMTMQVGAETEKDAFAYAKKLAEYREPSFAVVGIEMTLVGECDLGLGVRVVHRVFGPGSVEEIQPAGKEFKILVAFDSGKTVWIAGPAADLQREPRQL